MGQFIFDDLTKVPTILATNRVNRLEQAVVDGKPGAPAGEHACPFCKGNENLTGSSLYQDGDNWNVRVVGNKFPIIGDHEVVVHSPQHAVDISELPHEQNVRIVRAFLNRTHFYTSHEKEVLIFNNRGGKAGASILHPHSQIIALKGFPGIIELEKNESLHHYNEHNTCYWCDMVKEELASPARVIYESKHYVLLVPQASRWSYEMVLLPKEHRPNFEYITETEINDLARILKAALSAYDKLLDNPDRNFWFHTQRFDPFHWHIGFIPHTKVLGGLELGAGIWVSDRADPVFAASKLRDYVKQSYESEVGENLF